MKRAASGALRSSAAPDQPGARPRADRAVVRRRAAPVPVIIVLLLTLGLSLGGCGSAPAAAPARLVLDRSHHDQTVRAEQGQLIEIRLPAAVPPAEPGNEAPRWDIDRLDRPTLDVAAPPRFEAPGGDAGALGTAVFLLRAAQPGRAMVRLVYRHPWEQAVKGETFLAMIHVR